MMADNPNNDSLVLYTLVGCHLCEQVEGMLDDMGISYRPVEIDTDPALEKKYEISIPVLQRLDNGRELFYPFGQGQVMTFLERRF